MNYTPKNYDSLLGVPGFSDQLLKNHFSLYQGYVSNANKLMESLSTLAKEGKSSTPEFAEMTRRFAWEFNGMRLHELYFGNLNKRPEPIDKNSILFKKIVEEFGSYNNWEREFRDVGGMRGIGWAVLCLDHHGDKLINCWIDEHDKGHLAGTMPLVVLDVFEHAFMIDYGLKRTDYIQVFLKALDWKIVLQRYESAVRELVEA